MTDQAINTRAEKRKALTRVRLLETAQREMARRGIANTAVLDITEAADVALGTFYNHFASKEALLDVLADELAEELNAELRAVTDSAADPAEALAGFVGAVMLWFQDDPKRAAFVVEMGLSHRSLRTHFGVMLNGIIAGGAEEGRFLPGTSPVAAITIGGAVLSVMYARNLQMLPRAGTDEELVAQTLRLVGIEPTEAADIAARTVAARA